MKRFLKYTLITLLALPLLAAAFLWGLYLTADMEPPAMTVDTAAYRVADHGGYTSCRGSFLRHNRYGLWELYTAGSPEESGAAAGALTAGLMRYQEQVFVDQIREFIPSDGYLKFLRGLIVIFNRNLGRHVPEEYRREIYARSLYCSHDFDAIGTPYERQLNYHAAHDIGHAMSQYMLVGCSSFAAWGGMSADGGAGGRPQFRLLHGRRLRPPQNRHLLPSAGRAPFRQHRLGRDDRRTVGHERQGADRDDQRRQRSRPALGGDPDFDPRARNPAACGHDRRSPRNRPPPRHLRQRIAAHRIGARRKGRDHREDAPQDRPVRKRRRIPPSARTITSRPNWPATNTTSKTSPERTAPAASHGWRS